MRLSPEGVSLFDVADPTAESQSWTFAADIADIKTVPDEPDRFQLAIRGSWRGATDWTFVCSQRQQLLCDLFWLRDATAADAREEFRFATAGDDVEITDTGVCGVPFRDLAEVFAVADDDEAFVLRLRRGSETLLRAPEGDRSVVLRVLAERAARVGLRVTTRDSLAAVQARQQAAQDLRLAAAAEWPAERQPPPKRPFAPNDAARPPAAPVLLMLTAEHLLECDAATHAVLQARPLASVLAAAHPSHTTPQRLTLFFDCDEAATYDTPRRDALLLSLVAAAAALDPPQHVALHWTPATPSLRVLSGREPSAYAVGVAESAAVQRTITGDGDGVAFLCANVSPRGFLHPRPNAPAAIAAVARRLSEPNSLDALPAEEATALLSALVRLLRSREGFEAFTCDGPVSAVAVNRLLQALHSRNNDVAHLVLCALGALMTSAGADDPKEAERRHRAALLAGEQRCEQLVALLRSHARSQTGALVVLELLRLLESAVVPPAAATTPPDALRALVNALADNDLALALLAFDCRPITESVARLMPVVLDESDPAFAREMQLAALASGAFLRHLHLALFTANDVSRFLLGLWRKGCPEAEALLARALLTVDPDDVDSDVCTAHVQWNDATRADLRAALERELAAVARQRTLDPDFAWNHAEFAVAYPSLAARPTAHYYDGGRRVTLFLDTPVPGFPPVAFAALHREMLLRPAVPVLAALARVGPRGDASLVADVVALLAASTDLAVLDAALDLLAVLGAHDRSHADALIDAGGVALLVEEAAGVHRQRFGAVATALTTNLLESSTSAENDEFRFWYVQGEDRPRLVEELPRGRPELLVSTAPETEEFVPVKDVRQLRRELLGTGQPAKTPQERGLLCLDLLARLCRLFPADNVWPLPRVVQRLQPHLQHVVQILLTSDPQLVDAAAQLLLLVPPKSVNQNTGLVYFALLYGGANFEALAAALKHHRPPTDDLLPAALGVFLRNHDAAAFAQVFRGDSETPESIWHADMRARLAEALGRHVGAFAFRVREHVLARYAWEPAAAVRYPELDNELYCCGFYLERLCEAPDWPVPRPAELLHAVLEMWRGSPASAAAEQAAATLGVPVDARADDVRRAFHKLAVRFHPDRNPDGREQFERVQAAYETLCARPSPASVRLLLKTQAILYARHSAELARLRYPCYGLVCAELPLPEACEVLALTAEAARGNADELLRTEGCVALLGGTLDRVAGLLNQHTAADDPLLATAEFLVRTYAALAPASGVDAAVLPHAVAALGLTQRPGLPAAALALVQGLPGDDVGEELRGMGVLRRLLPLLFGYDVSVPEGVDSAANRLAEGAVRALQALPALHDDLRALLTPALDWTDLGDVMAEVESPRLIWGQAFRAAALEGAADPETFVHAALADELYVGRLYVRLVPQAPAEESLAVGDTGALVEWLSSSSSSSAAASANKEAGLVLRALAHLGVWAPGALRFLEVDATARDAARLVRAAGDDGDEAVMRAVLGALRERPGETAGELLPALASARNAARMGGVPLLVGMAARGEAQAARALARLARTRVDGAEVEAELRRWLPHKLACAVVAEPDAVPWDADVRTPELVWNGACLGQLLGALSQGDDDGVEYDAHQGLHTVAHVHLALLAQDPGFTLSAPQTLLEELLRRFPSDEGLVRECTERLLAQHPALRDHAARLGFVQRLFAALDAPGALALVRHLAGSEVALAAIPQLDAFAVHAADAEWLDALLAVARGGSQVVAALAREGGVVAALLASPLAEPAAIESLRLFGLADGRVQALLEASEQWQALGGQDHSLFLPSSTSSGGGDVLLLE